MEKWEILTATQGKYIDYISEQEKKANRIIFYKHNGHFGAKYAILSRYKKIELLSFKELKEQHGKNLLFRVLHIFTAIIAFVAHERSEIDARTSITTILSNIENIYLGIDKEKEYLKYLQIKKYPHKYVKAKFVIHIVDNDIDSDEDLNCLRILCKLIQSGRINNTVLLISGEKINMLNLSEKNQPEHIPVFELTENDLRFIASRNNIKYSESIGQNINLVKTFGIQFFLDNFSYFKALSDVQDQTFDWIKKMDWIITQIIKTGDIDRKEIYPLLEFTSFFERNFSKIEVQNFNNNELDADKLEIAHELAILSKEKSTQYIIPTYFYKIDSFRYYFSKKYSNDLQPMPKYVYEYFREYYPFEYMPALRVLQINTSLVDYKEKQSLVICGYYYHKTEKGLLDYKDYMCFVPKDSISASIIEIYEFFRNGKQPEKFNVDIEKTIRSLQNDLLDNIATCAAYVILLQFLKENHNHFPQISFSNILTAFRSKIIEIDTQDNYGKYWQTHFKCQYIAFSLEDEEANARTSRRFMDDIQNLREDENFHMYVLENHLKGFSRIDLLAFSMGYNNAGEILHRLYSSTESSTILKELARINYSAYLIETEKYTEAEKILQKVDINFLENINIDTYCGYLNNLYLVQLKCNKIEIIEYTQLVKKLLQKDINCGDKYIIENNLSTAYLMSGANDNYAITQLMKVLENGNPYNSFFALHNLLAYYYSNNNTPKFNQIYNKISIPKLLKNDTTFFYKKFKWMKDNMGKKDFSAFKKDANVIACYNQLYLMSSIERWFE